MAVESKADAVTDDTAEISDKAAINDKACSEIAETGISGLNIDESIDVEDLRLKGNEAYNQGHYNQAVYLYNKCLSADPSCIKARRNLAQAHIQRGDWAQAVIEARACLTENPQDDVSRARLASALMSAGAYQTALELLRESPNVKGGRAMVKEAEELMRETAGQFTWEKLYRQRGPRRFAEYVGPFVINSTVDEGSARMPMRAVRVTRDVEAGELLMVSNPVGVISYKSHYGTVNDYGALFNEVRAAIDCNILAAAQVSCLYDDSQTSLLWRNIDLDLFTPPMTEEELVKRYEKLKETDIPGAPLVSNFDLKNILRMCALTLDTTGLEENSWSEQHDGAEPFRGTHRKLALYGLPSLVNHSCQPNTVRFSIADTLFLRATKPIRAGEEVLVDYMDVTFSVNCLFLRQPDRLREIYDRWGFICQCTRCDTEATRLQEPLKHVEDIEMACRACVFATSKGEAIDEGVEPDILEKDVKAWDWIQKCAYGWLKDFMQQAETAWEASVAPADLPFCLAILVIPMFVMMKHMDKNARDNYRDLGQVSARLVQIIGDVNLGSLYHVQQASRLMHNLLSLGPGGQVLEPGLRSALRARYGPVPPDLLPFLERGHV
eukprot:jgi/Botrbrau1/15463/Bobra.43_2s0086.1